MSETSFSEANLLYVRKTYEDEVTEKARKIFADNTVQTTLDETNKKLDELIAEMNEKLGFVTNKITGSGGVEEYVKDVNNQIDTTAVDSTTLVDSGIVNTESHPSIVAFKNNRAETKYKTYDFINKTINIGFDDSALRFYNNTDIKSSDKTHTFKIHMSDTECIKIVEFSFTYAQCPNLVKIVSGTAYKEATTEIDRVFCGRFFIIRPDPTTAPDEIIVKAIVENADNTGNVIDEYAIDVKKSNAEDKISLKNELGPTFDIYFRVISASEIIISIGNINPYKYLLQKNYVDTNKTIVDNFNIVKSGIKDVNIDKFMYSSNMNKIFAVDETTKKVYLLPVLDKFDITSISGDSSLLYTNLSSDGLWVKDVGTYTFVGNNSNHCYVYNKGSSEGIDLGVMVEDAQLMSTNEIIVQVGSIVSNRKISTLYMFNYSTTSLNSTIFGNFHTSTIDINFIQKNVFTEYEPGKIILVSNSKNGTLYYKFLRLSSNTNTYTSDATSSSTIEQSISISDLEGFEPDNDGTSLSLAPSATGLFIHYNSTSSTNGTKTVIVSVRNLSTTTTKYYFEHVDILNKYDYIYNKSSTLQDVITKIVSTSLFTFGITSNNKLLIIDDKYIVDAVTFTSYQENGVSKGFTDKNSMLYLKPISGEKEYFLIDKPYLQNVKAVYQSFNGRVYIVDSYGIYELTTTKNLVCKFWTDDESFTSNIANKGTEVFVVSKSTTDGSQNIFCHDFTVDESSSKKLRHKYYDLVNGDYTKYDSTKDYTNYEMDTDELMIDFQAVLYCTLIDKLSSVYNSKDVNNISYTNMEYSFNDINPAKSHYTSFTINNENVSKDVTISKFTLSTNKYGFINYHGFTLLNTSNLSDVNDEKLYVLVHKTGDNLTIDDYRKVIYKLIKELTVQENEKYNKDGTVKDEYKSTVTVKKDFKAVNKNRIIYIVKDNDSVNNYEQDYGNHYTIEKTKFDAEDTSINLNTNKGITLNSLRYDSSKTFMLAGFKYFISFTAKNTVEIKKEKVTSDKVSTTSVKTIESVINIHVFDDVVYYSKTTGGLFKLDDSLNEVEVSSKDLGYIYYDFIMINETMYGISDKGILVKIDLSNSRNTPTTLINETNFSSNSTEVIDVGAIYKFSSSDKIFIHIKTTENNYKLFGVDLDNVSKYTNIQSDNNTVKIMVEFKNTIYAAGDKIYTFDPDTYAFDSISDYGHYKLTKSTTYDATSSDETKSNIIKLENTSDSSKLYDIKPYLFLNGDSYLYTIVSENIYYNASYYNFYKGFIIPDYEETVQIPLSTYVDENGRAIALNYDDIFGSYDLVHGGDINEIDKMVLGKYTAISRMSNKLSAGKKYSIEVDNTGRISINGDGNYIGYNDFCKDYFYVQDLPKDYKSTNKTTAYGRFYDSTTGKFNRYSVQDYKATVFKDNVIASYSETSGTVSLYKSTDTSKTTPLKLFTLNHKKCKWIALKFDASTNVSDLLNEGLLPYKYVLNTDETTTYEKVDTNYVKYPLSGIQYYTKTSEGSQDVYAKVSSDLSVWEVTSSGKVEYYEPKHHFELCDSTDIIAKDDYVYICPNRYFETYSTSNQNLTSLPSGNEYYTLETKRVGIASDSDAFIDERSVFILSDDRILIRASLFDYDDSTKTPYITSLIYDTYNENDLTRHDIWDKVYPKAGYEIRRVWETSKGIFGVYKLPCYDKFYLGLLSDDFQEIYCTLDDGVLYPGCIHLVENGDELLVSVASTNYNSVVCYDYNTVTNKFVKTTDSYIYMDSVVVDGETYLAAVLTNISDTNGYSPSVYVMNSKKEILKTAAMTVPLLNSNRNDVKQFDNIFIKRTTSSNKETAYLLFKVNTTDSDKPLINGFKISDGVVADIRLDINTTTFTSITNDSNYTHYKQALLTPDNKIFILSKYCVYSIDENDDVKIIESSGLLYTNHKTYVEYNNIATTNRFYYVDGPYYDLATSGKFSNDINLSVVHWAFYDLLCFTYLLDKSGSSIKIVNKNFESTDEKYYTNYNIKYDYMLVSDNAYGSRVLISKTNMYDPTNTILYHDAKTREDKINYTDTKYPKLLFNQKLLPIDIDGTLVFGTSIEKENTGKPSTDWYSLFDTDKTTLLHYYICFDYMFKTSSNKMFGIYKTDIYENDDVLSSSKWFKVSGGSVYNTKSSTMYKPFFKMIETDGGDILYIDGKNILRYDSSNDKFVVVTTTLDITTNTLNFAEKFDTGVFIGYKKDVEKDYLSSNKGTSDVSCPNAGIGFNIYDFTSHSFISLISDTSVKNMEKMLVSRIVDIKETSMGVFILYCANDSTYKNTIIRCYMSVNNIMTWEECKYKSTFTFLNGSKYTNQYPSNLNQIFEDSDTDTIWLIGSTYGTKDNAITYDTANELGAKCGAWAFRKYMENDNNDYRHSYGNNYRFVPNMPSSLPSEFKNTTSDMVYYNRDYSDSANLFNDLKGYEKIIETENFGKFIVNSNRHSIFIGKYSGTGINESITSITYFDYKDISGSLPYSIDSTYSTNVKCVDIKETDGNLYMIIQSYVGQNRIVILKYDSDADKWTSVINVPNSSASDYQTWFSKTFGIEDGTLESFNVGLVEKNGILYYQENENSSIYMIGDFIYYGSESNPETESNDVLYELRAIFDNTDSYNNLAESTSNSNLDKFVFKEIGVIDGITGNTKHIFQYFEPNGFYNGSDGTVKQIITAPKEFSMANSIKQLYKNVYQQFNRKTLINNRFIKPGQSLIADGFKHEVTQVLGDVEDYLTNTDNVHIELKIYPTETEDFINILNNPCTFGITTSSGDDESGIEPFDPYD